jgi:hypothetical protein
MCTEPLAQPAADPFASVDADLQVLEGLSPAEQVPVFDSIHRALTATLAASGTVPAHAGSPAGTPASGGA